MYGISKRLDDKHEVHGDWWWWKDGYFVDVKKLLKEDEYLKI